MSSVFRIGDTVHREAGPWTPQVHRLLSLLHARGVAGVPNPLGMDEEGREVLTFLHGEVGASPLAGTQRSEVILVQAATLLNAIHEATADVAGQWTTGWRMPVRRPAEVVCHGDFAPYNCVFIEGELVGVFDFDFAHPGPRLRDLACALYRFAPLADPCASEGFGTPAEQARRMRIFCDAYGLAERTNVLDMVSDRVQAMIDFLLEGLKVRDARRMAAVEGGHLRLCQLELACLEQHRAELESGLM